MCYDFLVKCMFIHGLSAEPEIYQKKGGGGLRRKITPPDPGELKFTTTVIAKIKEYTTLFEQPRLPSPYVRHK